MKKTIKLFLILLLTTLLVSCEKEEEKFFIESHNVVLHDDILIFPEPNSLVQIEIDTLGSDLPSTKAEGELLVLIKLTTGGASAKTYGTIKVQGTSTAAWPKKNWTLGFYLDEERNEKLRIKIGDSVATDKWITKADWIDPTQLRNSVSFGLWEAMVKSRKTFPQYEVDNAWLNENNMVDGIKTGAQGFPKNYPSQVVVNNEHYGISLLLMGHEPRNFNIDYNNPHHVYMEFDARFGYTTIKTWDKFSSSGIGEWIDGYYPKNKDFTQEQKDAIDELGALINGTQENFNNNFDTYLDKTNMIDMLLFIEAIYDWDAVAQDIEMVTYDLKKWYMLPWDKDTTFGMWWTGEGIQEEFVLEKVINYETEDEEQKPWFKTYHAYKKDIELRYKELRDAGIFSEHKITELISSFANYIPKEMWEAEYLRWDAHDRPSLDETSPGQIINWFKLRLEMLDEHFNYEK